ncbi:MAG TPA: FtsX-like permease family protein, partial [Acidobacteriota bacterium]|nr:FtsX-like permease family protein [Acidobacteriota bacterium]
RTLWNASAVDPGFPVDRGVVASIDVAKHGYNETTGPLFFEQFLQAVRQIPDVRSAAFARTVPVQNSGMRVSIEVEGYNPVSEEESNAEFNIVTPGFFGTLGVPILYGRDFTGADSATASSVAIINRAMAEKIWPGQIPVGKTLANVGPSSGGAQIVGVVADVRYRNLRSQPAPTIYVPHAQSYMPTMTLLIRTKGQTSILHAVLQKLQALDTELPLFAVQTLRQKLGVSLAQDRIVALLLSSFGVLALILAAVGLYTVISYSTQLRFKEFGIRMAIGATKTDLLELVLAKGIFLAVLGLLIGTLSALTASRLIENLLFGVRPNDPVTYVAIIVLLFLISLVACFIPAWRAARTDPTEALRYE